MKKLLAVLAVVGLAAGFAASDVSADKEAKFEATCPVSGGGAKKEHSVKQGSKTVYFCCPNCPKAYKKDSKKFANKVNAQFLETKQITQIGCPISGRPIDATKTAALGKAKVAFCCGNCLAKAEASDDLAKLAFASFDKGFTLQTKCPVSGKPIKADKVVAHKGKNVFFCCPGCPGAFEANPDKFLAKLPQFAAKK